jgi:hypothetical protein
VRFFTDAAKNTMAFLARVKAQALCLLASRLPHADAASIERAVLYAVYGSDIAQRLARIHAHRERDGPDGTLVVALHGRTRAQVRCAFAQLGDVLLCEAVADPRTMVGPSASAAERALHTAGYRQDASGRWLFPYEITPDSTVWGGAAAVILGVLIDAFGARAGSRIEIAAPLAPERDAAAIRREWARH